MKRNLFIGLSLLTGVPMAAQQKQQEHPNLIFVITDQLRNDVFGCRGDEIAKTPNIDRFKSESADFTNAIAVTPVLAAARASLFTGKYSTSTGMVINELRLNPNQRAWGHVLTENGYNTSYIGKWHLYGTCSDHHQDECAFIPKGPDRLGFDGEWKAYNFHHNNMNSYYYEDKKEKIYYGEGTYEPEEQFKMAIHSLERLHDEKKPFALFLSVGVPHDPWTKDNVPAKYYDRYKDAPFTLPSNWSDVPDKYMDRNANPQKWVNYWKKNIPEMKRVYYSMVSSIDDYMGELMDKVSELGLDENTIIVFFSDHGEMFGENGRIFKMIFYDSAAKVPFLVRWKGKIQPGLEIDACLNTPDIMPTLLGMMQLPVPETVEGMDLSPLAFGKKCEEPDFAFMQGMGHTFQWKDGHEWRAVRDKRYTYAKYLVDGKELLFDNVNDPKQTKNLVAEPEFAEILVGKRQQMASKMKELNDEFKPCSWYRGHWVDENRCIRAAAKGKFCQDGF